MTLEDTQDIARRIAANLVANRCLEHDDAAVDDWAALKEELAKETLGVIRGLYLSGDTASALKILNNINISHLKDDK